MGRIINVAITNANGTVNNRYKYDLLGRLVREDNKEVGTTTLFEYDTNGNMLKKSVADYSTSDTFTVKSEPSFTVSSDYADYIESYDGKAIETSSIGNITEVGTTSYLWTRAKLLSQVKKSATDYVNYNYDGEGLRISKSHYNNGVTTTHTYIRDGKKILVEKINNGTTEKVLNYLYLGENVIGFVYNNAYYHFQKNLQNDIIAIYNESGIKVAAYEYDAWGNHTITLDTNSIGSLNPFRYRGYYYDEETQLFYCNSRYYSPELCRWISPDSIEYLDPESINGLNLYAYCYDNPVNMSDPSGNDAILITDYEWLDGGLPILGHSALIVEDEDGIWWLTELSGSINDKTTAKVVVKMIGTYEDVLNYERFQNGNDLWSKICRYLKISGNDWVYLKGDYSASLRAANEFEKNQDFGSYHVIKNNCLHYVKSILKESLGVEYSDFGFLNFNTNILPQTFSRNVRKIKFRNLIKKYFKSLFEK